MQSSRPGTGRAAGCAQQLVVVEALGNGQARGVFHPTHCNASRITNESSDQANSTDCYRLSSLTEAVNVAEPEVSYLDAIVPETSGLIRYRHRSSRYPRVRELCSSRRRFSGFRSSCSDDVYAGKTQVLHGILPVQSMWSLYRHASTYPGPRRDEQR